MALWGTFYTKNHERTSWLQYLRLPVKEREKLPSNARWNKTNAAVHYADIAINRLQLIAQALPEEELVRAFPPKRLRALIYAICGTRRTVGHQPTTRQYDTALEIATVLAPFGDLVTGLYETLSLGAKAFGSGAHVGSLRIVDESPICRNPRNYIFAPAISEASIPALKSPETRLLKVALALKKWRSPVEAARITDLEVPQVRADIQRLMTEGLVASNKEGRYKLRLAPRAPPVTQEQWYRHSGMRTHK